MNRHAAGLATALTSILLGAAVPAAADETIVFLRHGEKPTEGLGQLSCQGLHRSLALPAVLGARFGPPAAIFAPDPGIQKDDKGTAYSYVRPLATIEPTAIVMGRPVETRLGFKDIDALKTALLSPKFANKVVFVAWEHHFIEDLVKQWVRDGGGAKAAAAVPAWSDDDFDSLYILTIGADGRVTFRLEAEQLNGQSSNCSFGP